MAVVCFSVWRSPERFELIDVLVLGLVAWMLPLRQVHNFYLIWYTIPFLMRGNLPKSIIMVSLQVIAAFVAPLCWVGFTDWRMLPTPPSALCFFAIAILYAVCGGLVFSFTLRARFAKLFYSFRNVKVIYNWEICLLEPSKVSHQGSDFCSLGYVTSRKRWVESTEAKCSMSKSYTGTGKIRS